MSTTIHSGFVPYRQDGKLVVLVNAPVTVVGPGALLAFLTAVFGPPAPTALGKLSRVLFPLVAREVGTLPNAPFGIVLSAQVSHNHPSPVLHVGAVIPDGEPFHKREDVLVIREQVLLLQVLAIFLNLGLECNGVGAVEQAELLANLESGHEMALLEIWADRAVL